MKHFITNYSVSNDLSIIVELYFTLDLYSVVFWMFTLILKKTL